MYWKIWEQKLGSVTQASEFYCLIVTTDTGVALKNILLLL
jgi:hypothetical protein